MIRDTTGEHALIIISGWKNLESTKSVAGKEWEESFLPEGYEEIPGNCSIEPIGFDGKLASQVQADAGKAVHLLYNKRKQSGDI